MARRVLGVVYAEALLLTHCDCRADSSPAGYGERQRRVLAKRGIAWRRSWAAARALVA